MRDEILSSTEFAKSIGIKSQTVRKWRLRGGGPEFLRWSPLGPVFYLVEDVESWIRTHRFSSTSEETVRDDLSKGRRRGKDRAPRVAALYEPKGEDCA